MKNFILMLFALQVLSPAANKTFSKNLQSPTTDFIEIIGTSVPPYDWTAGVLMQTADGITYTLSSYPLQGGELKFRQNFDWAVNWGASTFPTGTGYQDGPNIPITAGTYNITFNRETGDYNFECTSCGYTIGIIGTAVPPFNDWDNEIAMSSVNGFNYTLNHFYLSDGELKFRQDNDWAINWGNTTFPSGTGIFGGPNIPVTAGIYNISFNRLTGEYNFQLDQPFIGILGTSLSGWTEDINMQTTDYVNYYLYNYPLAAGEVKFRQDDQWNINWGENSFPNGQGFQDGPNIPVPYAGNYDVYFNRIWGYYSFSLVCPALSLQCPSNITVNAEDGLCAATVNYNWPTVSSDCGNPFVYQLGGSSSGSYFPVGVTTNRYYAYSFQSGQLDSCSFDVTVIDNQPPVISNVSTDKTSLWPPNHKMQTITVNYNTSDNCNTVSSSLTVSSSDPVNGTGDGDTGPDWSIIDDHHVLLRSERSGSGSGRIYTITIHSTDTYGNTSEKTVTVSVSKNTSPARPIYNVYNEFSCKVLPNPAVGYFSMQVSSPSGEKIEMRLTDISGRTITKMNVIKDQPLRFGEDLKAGVYIIEVIQGDQRKMIKLVKQ